MKRATLLFFASITLGIMTPIGCGPSSTSRPPDAGPTESGAAVVQDAAGLADAIGASCNPLVNSLCPEGLTCCFSGLLGTCKLASACRSPFQIGCTSQASCASGEACCGSGTGANFALFCKSACSTDEFQICRSNGECPVGTTCVEVARGATTMVCAASPGTGRPPEDAGDDGTSDASALE